jgi:uncharacterized membrane protein (DUF485 family)
VPIDVTVPPALDEYYSGMAAERRRLIRPLVLIVLVFYFTLPILTNFTSILDGLAFDGLTWAYVYAFAQFVMVIALTTYYRRRMDRVEARLRPAEIVETAAQYDKQLPGGSDATEGPAR